MDPEQPTESRAIDRRTLLKGGLAAGGLLVGGLTIRALADPGERPAPAPAPVTRGARERRPNILVILVDQMRFPQWLGASALGPALPPNLQRLRSGAVAFARHYTVSNDCTPSRAALADGAVHAPDGLHDHGRQHARPGLPDVGDDAPRARLQHALVG